MKDQEFAKRVYNLFTSLMKQKAFGSLVIDIGDLNDVMMEAHRRFYGKDAEAKKKTDE